MRIVVNHLTRMHGGRICIAGIDVDTGRHVRPVLREKIIPFYALSRYGGPFEMARLVELGKPRPTPEAPHFEDHVFVESRAKPLRTASPDEFWSLLHELSSNRLRQIFGDALQKVGSRRYGTQPGQGIASLGCLRPSRLPELFLQKGRDGRQRVRMKITDGPIEAEVGVTDLRLFKDDHATPDPARISSARQRIEQSEGIVLGVGLTRQYSPSDDVPPVHYLQVTNIHLHEDPTWPLG